jgi:hypothetical protein
MVVVAASLTLLPSILLADAAPPPPPEGTKYVGVENSVAVDEGVAGYVFVQCVAEGRGGGGPQLIYSSVKLGEKATALTAGEKTEGPPGRRGKVVWTLTAVPAEAAKKYATEKELAAAVAANSIPNTHRLQFTGVDTLPTNDKRNVVPWKYMITAIDAKDGISVKKERDGKPVDKDAKADGKEPQVREASDLRWLVAGLAAALGLSGLGLWLGRRRAATVS